MHNKILKFLVFFVLLFSTIERVNASTLVKNKEENIYYERIGGEEGYFSAHFSSYTMDGKTAYCIEPGKRITSQEYVSKDGMVNSPFSPIINEKIELIGYYGYDYPNHQTIKYRMATQELIWEAIDGSFIINFTTERNGQGDPINIDKEKEEIMRLVEHSYILPSFIIDVHNGVIGEDLELVDENNVLSEFEVFNDGGCNIKVEGNKLILSDLKAGFKSIGFIRKKYTQNKSTIFVGIDDDTQTMAYFGLDSPSIFWVYADIKGGQITLHKKDKKTLSGIPSGDCSFEGTEFNLYNEKNEWIDFLTLDENLDTKTSRYLDFGKYCISESKFGKGYQINEQKYCFEITKDNLDQEMDFYNLPIESKLELYKVLNNNTTGEMQGEKNITFDIYLKRNMELKYSITTDENGYASVDIPYGTYIVKQRNTTLGYEKVPDFEIVIDEYTPPKIVKILSDTINKVKLKVKKIDAVTKEIIKLDGIKFKIKNLDTNKYVCQNNDCIYETKNGIFITPKELLPGHYALEEVEDQIIKGYKWNSTPLTFEIGNNEDVIKENGEYYLELEFANNPVKGKITITKYGENVKYQNNSFQYEEILLDNVTYSLYALDDIMYNGKLIYKKDSLIGSYITNKGKILIEDLYLGNYYLKETKTLNNYVLDENIYEVNIINNNQYDDVVEINYTFKNNLIKGNLKLIKRDSDSHSPLANVTFEIYDVNNNKLIYRGKTDKNGQIEIANIYQGQFYLIETDTLNNYVLNNSKKYFEIIKNNTTIEITMNNSKIRGNLKIIKKDKDSGKLLNDTYINIYTRFDELVYEGVTDENGEIFIENLLYGDYYLKEIKNKDGYVLNDEKIDFKIRTNNATITINVNNEQIKGNLLIIKKDKDSLKVLNNTYINVYDINDNLIYEGITDENGEIFIENLPYGEYYLKEITSQDGYVLNTEIIKFKIQNNKETVKLEIFNEQIKGKLYFIKEDKDTHERLNDTYIQVYNTYDELIYEGYTNEYGEITIDNLPYGKYYIIEHEAKEGYILYNGRIYFEIKNNNQIIELKMENEKIPEVKEDFVVPNTYYNDYIVNIVIISLILGISLLFYEKKEKY